LAVDQEIDLQQHRAFVSRQAAEQSGQIVKLAGDGYWLEFPSVTAAAKSAIAMQEALIVAQPGRVDRLSIRVVIGLGDVAVLDNEWIGDLAPLILRIEGITQAGEIYLTQAARLALAPAEVQTMLVNNFPLKGFVEPVPVYRVEQRHRIRFIPKAYILDSDLRSFRRLIETESETAIENVLDTLDMLIHRVAREFEGTIRFSVGDTHCLTFTEAPHLIAAADNLSKDWATADREMTLGHAINIVIHCGEMRAFRSFLHGEGMSVVRGVQKASLNILADREGGVFVTSAVRDGLVGTPWQDRLELVAVNLGDHPRFLGLDVYRLRVSGRLAEDGQLAGPFLSGHL
jgi:class 3 adenylate cyclase